MILSAVIALVAAGFLVIVARAQADTCISGYVWREAFPGDHVCVTPQTRAQAAYDNRHAIERYDPESLVNAISGGETCLAPYVPREAGPGDEVCVTPETRAQAQYDNGQAKNRLAYTDRHTYKNTSYWRDDLRVDWCVDSGRGCGQPAADNFCNRKHWTGAAAFEQDPDVGASTPTITGRSFEVCNQSFCDGFKYITCYGQIWNDRVYNNPKWNGKLLDSCYVGNKYCSGKKAADAYCRQYQPYKEFTKSFYYLVSPELSDYDTSTIGDGEVYDHNKYDLQQFILIICQ
jgi:hypothetical protein